MLPGIPFRYGVRGLNSLLADGNTAARYRANAGVTGALNASQWDDQSGNGRHLLQGTGANQPIYLSYAGAKYAYLPGVASNNFTTPDAAANRITGDIAVTWHGAMNDWTPAAINAFAAKDEGGADAARAWGFLLDTTGKLLLQAFSGAYLGAKLSTVATAFTDGSEGHVAFTRASASGDIKFYTSTDGVTWVQLGDTVSSTAAGLNAGTGRVQLGVRATDYPQLGKSYRLRIFNGIPPMLGGAASATPAQEWLASDWAETTTNGATQVSSTTGETWTLNNTGTKPAQIVGSPQLLFDGTAHNMATGAFTLGQPLSYYIVVSRNTDSAGTWTLFDGLGAGRAAFSWSPSRYYLFGGVLYDPGTVNSVIKVMAVLGARFNAASSFLFNGTTQSANGNAGSSSPDGITLGSNITPANYGAYQVKELIVRAAADSAATQLAIIRRLAQIHGIVL